MTNRLCLVVQSALIAVALLAPSACSEDNTKWEVGREAIGGHEAERERVDEEWGLYRDDLVRSLDQMDASLQIAAGGGAVFDRKEIDALLARIAGLRQGIVALVDEPRESLAETRIRLRGEFKATRADVDAVLERLGHNPDDIARWQDDD